MRLDLRDYEHSLEEKKVNLGKTVGCKKQIRKKKLNILSKTT